MCWILRPKRICRWSSPFCLKIWLKESVHMGGTDNLLSKPNVGMNTIKRPLVKKGHSKKNSIFWLRKTLMHFYHLSTDIRFKSPKFSALYSTQEKHNGLNSWLKNIFWSLAVVDSIHRSRNAENSQILSHWKKKGQATLR